MNSTLVHVQQITTTHRDGSIPRAFEPAIFSSHFCEGIIISKLEVTVSQPNSLRKAFAMGFRKTFLRVVILTMFIVALSSLGFAQGPPPPGLVWGHGPRPNRGACFYKDVNFGGE